LKFWEAQVVEFETRIVVVVRDDLKTWQKLNVTAFVMGGIAGIPGLLGEPYEDADGRSYLPMIRQPVRVYSAPREGMRRVYERALERGVALSLYTEELFATGGDEENRAAVRAVRGEDLNLAGLAVHGDRRVVDKVVRGLKLHE
jgi:hypothetical protein